MHKIESFIGEANKNRLIERLPCEKELGKMLGVGRSSLREALRSLEIMGIVETHNGAGTFVAHDTEAFLQKPLAWGVLDRGKSLKELGEARTIIEMAILPLVIERITDQEIVHLEALVEQMEAARRSDREMMVEKDIQFHMLLAKATKNGVLREAIRLGVAKVCYGTYVKQRYLEAVREVLGADEPNPHKRLGYGGPEDVLVVGRLTVKRAVLERIGLLGSCGKA